MTNRNRRVLARLSQSRARFVAPAAAVTAVALTAGLLASSSATASTNWATATSAQAGGGMTALVAAAKAEGQLNVITLPSNWANYGTIMKQFTAKYGATVLAAPTTQGFDLVAWIAPFAVFGAALLGTILLIRRWSGISAAKAAAAGPEPAVLDPAELERREKIRRETGIDGGY